MLTYLPTRSLLTRAMKSSGLKSRSSTRAFSLARDVVTQPLGIEAEVHVALRRDAGPARLRHLLAGEGDEAVDEDVVGGLAAREMQHRRPEQRVEVDDVLADEVVLLDGGIGEEGREVARLAQSRRGAGIEVPLQRREVADRGVEPDVEVLLRRAFRQVGDLDAEVGRVARDVPVGERGAAFAQPLLDLVEHLGLQRRRLRPLLQERDDLGRRQPEEEVLGRAHLGRRAGDRRVGMLQVGRRIGGAADLAGVAELVLGAALRALALDVAVRQEHALDRIVELLDGPGADQPAAGQRAVDALRELDVLRRVRRVRGVEADQVARPVGPVRLGDPRRSAPPA